MTKHLPVPNALTNNPMTPEEVRRASFFRTVGLIFLLAFAIRVFLVMQLKEYRELDRPETVRTAISLAQDGTFSNPFPTPTGPTAHVAPLYPWILSLIFKAFGTGTKGEFVKQILTCAAVALQYALLPFVASAWGLSARIGALAGFLGASFGVLHIWYDLETKGNFEYAFVSLALILLFLLTLRCLDPKHGKITDGIALGIAWGFTLLLAPSAVLIMIGFTAFLILRRGLISLSLTSVFCAVLVLVPWTIRNYQVFGHVFFIRDNFGLELSASNNDSAWPTVHQNHAKGNPRHPFSDLQEATKLRTEGERNYYQGRLHEAEGWIRAHPGRFFRLTLNRIWYFWFSTERPLGGAERTSAILVKSVLLWCITTAGFLGVALAVRRRQDAGILLAIIVAVYPVSYYLVQFETRYAYPIQWCMLVAACSAVTALRGKFLSRRSNTSRKPLVPELISPAHIER